MSDQKYTVIDYGSRNKQYVREVDAEEMAHLRRRGMRLWPDDYSTEEIAAYDAVNREREDSDWRYIQANPDSPMAKSALGRQLIRERGPL